MNTLSSSRSRVMHKRAQENEWWGLMSWEADQPHRNQVAAAKARHARARALREGKQSCSA